MSNTTVISFRASAAVRRRLAELGERRGVSRSRAIVAAVMEAASPGDLAAVPDEKEVLELLSEAARAGSVPAMRELRAYWRERGAEPEGENPLAEFDELAARRGGDRDGGGGRIE